MNLIAQLKDQPRSKMVFAGIVAAGILFMALINPRDTAYFGKVEQEIKLAMLICEESQALMYEFTDRLKMDDNILDKIPINGQIIKLKYVEYPKVLLFSQGFEHTQKDDELFCSFKDPRSGKSYFYSYNTRTWDTKSRTRL